MSTRLFGAALLTGVVVSASTQSVPALSKLTVPATALPAGCALKPAAPRPSPAADGVVAVYDASSLFPVNPWVGVDRGFVRQIRVSMDGVPRLPDGPPPHPREAAAFESQLADHVLEAYHAIYEGADGSRIVVSAVTFDDVTLARPDPLSVTMNPPRGFRSRIVRGATVVLVTASAENPCARLIDTYVRSVK